MRKLALAIALSTAAVPAAAAELVTNGNFEAGPSGAFTPPQGWTVAPGSEIGNVAGSAYVPCCGVSGTSAQLANRFATFGPGDVPNVSTLTQVLNTAVASNYLFTFDFGVLGGGAQTLLVRVLDGSNVLATGSYTQGANNNLGSTFASKTLNFVTGSGSTTTIEFSVDAVTGSVDGIVDNVSVLGAIPEPATWAMMILGFGFVGGAMRKRTRSAKIAFA